MTPSAGLIGRLFAFLHVSGITCPALPSPTRHESDRIVYYELEPDDRTYCKLAGMAMQVSSIGTRLSAQSPGVTHMQTYRVAMIGYRFMGKAHSLGIGNAPFFFDDDLLPVKKVICGRNEPLVKGRPTSRGAQGNGKAKKQPDNLPGGTLATGNPDTREDLMDVTVEDVSLFLARFANGAIGTFEATRMAGAAAWSWTRSNTPGTLGCGKSVSRNCRGRHEMGVDAGKQPACTRQD